MLYQICHGAVSFADEEILHDINFEIRNTEKIAVVGPFEVLILKNSPFLRISSTLQSHMISIFSLLISISKT